MSDELSREVIDQIIFGMENQYRSFVYDTVEQVIVSTADVPGDAEPDRFLELPEWNSSMGFNLMERFVSTLRNPLFRDVLRETLAAGRGVFRNFKNALKERPDIEQLWYRYKEKEMRKLVVEWYNGYREAVGLGMMAIDDNETTELVLSDFRLGPPETLTAAEIAELAELDRRAFFEMFDDYPEEIVERLYLRSRGGRAPRADTVLVAVVPDGRFAGFIWYEEEPAGENMLIGWIRQLTVIPEYRGLGIAITLLEKYIEQAARSDVDRLFVEFGGPVGNLSRVLQAIGFESHSVALTLDLAKWEGENLNG